ncbi:MAG: hypothetical protein Q7R52_02405 [archaeon]|nr:hypothetical protein [archaeon]
MKKEIYQGDNNRWFSCKIILNYPTVNGFDNVIKLKKVHKYQAMKLLQYIKKEKSVIEQMTDDYKLNIIYFKPEDVLSYHFRELKNTKKLTYGNKTKKR